MATIKKAQAGITAKKKTFKSNPDSGGNVPMPQGRKGTPTPPKGLSGKAKTGLSIPKKNSVSKNIGNLNKAKDGKSFPDLNKDGKITKADILKGRGVIAKKGATIKKAQDGENVKVSEKKNSSGLTTSKYRSSDGNYKSKFSWKEGASKPSSIVERRTVKGFLTGAPKAEGKYDTSKLKKGGSVKKCKYGCK